MIEGQEGVTWEEWRALAAACERQGLERLFRSDHCGSLLAPGRGSLDAWATLAALAAETSRIRLGTMVSPATFRHPSELAKVVATVDHVSGGRVELGLGAGWNGFPSPSSSRSSTAPGSSTSSTSTAAITRSRATGRSPSRCRSRIRR